MKPYRPRLVDPVLEELFADFPAVLVTGGRATGKTTSASRLASEIVRLDQPGVAEAFRADPDAALRRTPRPMLLDEWQEVPEVLPAVKRAVDADRRPGQFLLTGSVRADLAHETWAGTGRVLRLSLHGLTERELAPDFSPRADSFLTKVVRSGLQELTLPRSVPDLDAYVELALRGGFPDVAYVSRSERARTAWLASYLDDLVTRDAATVGEAKDPVRLRRYLRALAEHTAGQPTDRTLYESAGVNARTALSYEQLLTNLYVVEQVPAWSTNRLKRLVRGRKRYLLDTGLAAAAAQLSRDDVLRDGDLRGRLFDTFCLAQLRPELALSQPSPQAFHLRMEGGRREVDLLIELSGGRVVAIETKAIAAPTSNDARHLHWLRDELGADFVAGVVLHCGPSLFELGDRVYAVPLCALWG